MLMAEEASNRKGKQMDRTMLLQETANIRRSILAHNASLVADNKDFTLGRVCKEEAALSYALFMLEYAEWVFESNECKALTCAGIAIGILVDRGLVILEQDTQLDLLQMESANTLPA
jgi:hypothetical protein